MIHTLLCAASALALSVPASAQELTPAETAAIGKAVGEVLAETGVPSAEISVVRGGRIVLNKAWGKASERIPVATPALPYQIASNSKQFLAALILLLEDDGKLSLDDKVAKWLPDVSGADRITIRQLLSHTSGLQDYWPQDYSFAAMEKPVRPEDIVARWAKKPLDYEPGTRWQYSNTGYVVAGLIAEKAGGASLWSQFEARLFKPLGIHPLPLDETNGPQFPQGYHRNALGPVRTATPPARGWLWAAGELSMTAEDLAKWNLARIERKLLTPEDWATMERPVVLKDGTTAGYGLGVSAYRAGGREVIDHGGESVGFLSQNTVWPDSKVAVTVLTNADFAGAQGTLTSRIADIVMPKAVVSGTPGEGDRIADAKAELATLMAGTLEKSRFTENAQYYFKPETLADYRDTLQKLGPPSAVEAPRPPRLRGGFVNRVFKVKWPSKTLTLSTYAEAGAQGRWEQFLLMPE